MKKLFLNFSTVSLMIASQFSVNAGSYLFCGNDKLVNNEMYSKEGIGWNWAKGIKDTKQNQNQDNIYYSFYNIYDKGAWIDGWGDMSVNGEFFLLVSNTFENKNGAIEFCSSLKNKCEIDFGSDFTHVGVFSWSIPQAAWGSIAVNYNEYGNKKWTTCPNWKYPENKEYQELNYLSLGKAAAIGTVGAVGAVAGIATGAVIYSTLGAAYGGAVGGAFGGLIGGSAGVINAAATGSAPLITGGVIGAGVGAGVGAASGAMMGSAYGLVAGAVAGGVAGVEFGVNAVSNNSKAEASFK